MDKDLLAFQQYSRLNGGYTPSYLSYIGQAKAKKPTSTGLGSIALGAIGAFAGGAGLGALTGGAGAIPGAIGGGAAGSALGEALDQLVTGGRVQDVGAVGREAAFGAIPGVLGAAGKGVKAVRSSTKLADALASAGAKTSAAKTAVGNVLKSEGGYIGQPRLAGKFASGFHPDDLNIMTKFIDSTRGVVKLSKPESLRLQADAAAVAEGYGLRMPKTTSGLAKVFEKEIESRPGVLDQVKGVLSSQRGAIGLGEDVGAVRKGASKASDFLSVKALKLNPSQMQRYSKVAGEDVTATIKRHGLQGAGADDIANKAETLQDAFDAIARNPSVTVPVKNLQNNIGKVVSELKKSPASANRQLATNIEQEAANVIAKARNGKLAISDLTDFRQQYDKLVKNFATDPIASGTNRAVGTILRNTIQEAADKAGLKTAGGQSLKEAGRELNRLYELAGMAGRQEYLGRGTNLINLSNLLGAAAGGFPGMVATAAVNSRPVVKAASQGLAKFADTGIPGSKLAGALAANTVGQGLTRATLNPMQPQDQAPEMAPMDMMQMTQPDMTAQEDTRTLTPTLVNALLAQILSNPDGKAQAQQLNTLKEALAIQEAMAPQAGGNIKKTETQRARDEAAQLADEAVAMLQGGGIQTGMIAGPLENIKAKFNAADEKTLRFNTLAASLRAAIAKARAGTSFTEGEKKMLQQYTPNVGDSAQELATKLQLLKQTYDAAVAREYGTQYVDGSTSAMSLMQ